MTALSSSINLDSQPAKATVCRLTRLAGQMVHELKGGPTLTQALAAELGEYTPGANAACPLTDGGALLRSEPEGWLLAGPQDNSDRQKLLQAAQKSGYTVDATHGYCLIQLTGADAPEWLARHCTLDLRHDAFAVHTCARTPVAQVPVIIHRRDDTHFIFICPTSYSEYLLQVLQDDLSHASCL